MSDPLRDYWTERWKFEHAIRIIPAKRAMFHPATTHALINRIPEREALMTYNFWQAMNLRLLALYDDALVAWEEANGR